MNDYYKDIEYRLNELSNRKRILASKTKYREATLTEFHEIESYCLKDRRKDIQRENQLASLRNQVLIDEIEASVDHFRSMYSSLKTMKLHSIPTPSLISSNNNRSIDTSNIKIESFDRVMPNESIQINNTKGYLDDAIKTYQKNIQQFLPLLRQQRVNFYQNKQQQIAAEKKRLQDITDVLLHDFQQEKEMKSRIEYEKKDYLKHLTFLKQKLYEAERDSSLQKAHDREITMALINQVELSKRKLVSLQNILTSSSLSATSSSNSSGMRHDNSDDIDFASLTKDLQKDINKFYTQKQQHDEHLYPFTSYNDDSNTTAATTTNTATANPTTTSITTTTMAAATTAAVNPDSQVIVTEINNKLPAVYSNTGTTAVSTSMTRHTAATTTAALVNRETEGATSKSFNHYDELHLDDNDNNCHNMINNNNSNNNNNHNNNTNNSNNDHSTVLRLNDSFVTTFNDKNTAATAGGGAVMSSSTTDVDHCHSMKASSSSSSTQSLNSLYLSPTSPRTPEEEGVDNNSSGSGSSGSISGSSGSGSSSSSFIHTPLIIHKNSHNDMGAYDDNEAYTPKLPSSPSSSSSSLLKRNITPSNILTNTNEAEAQEVDDIPIRASHSSSRSYTQSLSDSFSASTISKIATATSILPSTVIESLRRLKQQSSSPSSSQLPLSSPSSSSSSKTASQIPSSSSSSITASQLPSSSSSSSSITAPQLPSSSSSMTVSQLQLSAKGDVLTTMTDIRPVTVQEKSISTLINNSNDDDDDDDDEKVRKSIKALTQDDDDDDDDKYRVIPVRIPTISPSSSLINNHNHNNTANTKNHTTTNNSNVHITTTTVPTIGNAGSSSSSYNKVDDDYDDDEFDIPAVSDFKSTRIAAATTATTTTAAATTAATNTKYTHDNNNTDTTNNDDDKELLPSNSSYNSSSSTSLHHQQPVPLPSTAVDLMLKLLEPVKWLSLMKQLIFYLQHDFEKILLLKDGQKQNKNNKMNQNNDDNDDTYYYDDDEDHVDDNNNDDDNDEKISSKKNNQKYISFVRENKFKFANVYTMVEKIFISYHHHLKSKKHVIDEINATTTTAAAATNTAIVTVKSTLLHYSNSDAMIQFLIDSDEKIHAFDGGTSPSSSSSSPSSSSSFSYEVTSAYFKDYDIVEVILTIFRLFETRGNFLFPSELLNGVLTVDKLTKEHKRSGGYRVETWLLFTSHLFFLTEYAAISTCDVYIRCLTTALSHTKHPDDTEMSRFHRKVYKLLQSVLEEHMKKKEKILQAKNITYTNTTSSTTITGSNNNNKTTRQQSPMNNNNNNNNNNKSNNKNSNNRSIFDFEGLEEDEVIAKPPSVLTSLSPTSATDSTHHNTSAKHMSHKKGDIGYQNNNDDDDDYYDDTFD